MDTYQDLLRAADKAAFAADAAARWRASPFFRRGLTANSYFRGENTAIRGKTILQADKLRVKDSHGRSRVKSITKDVVGSRIGSGFLFRFVSQQNQYLLQNGCILPMGVKQRLGGDFDHVLQSMGERALLQGVCWGFWNVDHLEMIEAASDALSGFVPLPDERDGRIRAGIRFWQLEPHRPLYLRLFEEDGVTLLRRDGHGDVTVEEEKRGYGISWGRLPVIPLWANSEHMSELTDAVKAKIDAYDRILSDLSDNLDRANDVYWVLNNFGGTSDDIAEMLAEINRIKAVASLSDGTGAAATAEPRTIEVPYAARQTALKILEKALYADFMALDTEALTGGSLTNVAIRAACANLNLKSDRYEWQVCDFVQQLLTMTGLPADSIRFQRQTIGNDLETMQTIALMREDIDRETALKLNPLIQPEEAERLLKGAGD